ncbi:MAG: MupG family TIM beta-alpha barrel fold protein [Lachnospiraceae bacterium]|nr:MupG family TIM beta-alpha barrel fold protein [Lachnospiraceae bacterium]
MLGVSVYPDLSPRAEIQEYLKLAASYGCTRVFSSMFSVEGSAEEVLALFEELICTAHEVGMEVSLDVNGQCLKKLGASPENLEVFYQLGCDILRMDVPMGTEEMLKLIDNPYGIRIEMNASMGERGADYVRDLIRRGADPKRLLLCHNFYPQRYTGMKWEKFLQTNQTLKETGVPICAFIASHAENTYGVWDAKDGLCTVEKHRDLPIDLQLREMLATECVDDVEIGNAYASEEELKSLQEVMTPFIDSENNPMHAIMKSFGAAVSGETKAVLQKKVRITLDEKISELEKEILFQFYPHRDMGDSSEWIWRSRMPRMMYADRSIPARPFAKEWFQRGDVMIVNDNYKHYAGEVQIALRPVKNDGTRNLAGRLSLQEQEMLELIHDNDTVVFLKG